MNKIGICEWSLPIDGPFACKLVADLGLDGLQIDIGPYERGFSKSRKFVQDAYLEAAAKYSIEFPSMATRVSDYYSLYAEPGTAGYGVVRSGVLKAVEACEYMNIPLILVPTFEKSYIDSDSKFAMVVDLYKAACAVAAESGITIAAENTLSVSKTRELVERVGAENFGIYFDTQNYFLSNNDFTPDVLEQLYPHIVEVHVKDGKDKDLSGALLGTGDADFFKSIEVLKKHKYDGWLISENYYDMKPLCGLEDDPIELIRKDLQILKSAIQNTK
ncbi:MAG: sugar phosphate isomerase/epimerase [Bacteroidetes bacterium]|nr:sugar phosphate isomerase/epimerase [Bacteroidota bacterium]